LKDLINPKADTVPTVPTVITIPGGRSSLDPFLDTFEDERDLEEDSDWGEDEDQGD
jgi:hypothetical protein